jgi:hypothetical protein
MDQLKAPGIRLSYPRKMDVISQTEPNLLQTLRLAP